MVGDAIKVSPVLSAQGTETHFKVFFPQGNWVSMADYSTLVVKEDGDQVLDFPDTTVHAHLRPGSIVPVQDNTDVMTAADLTNKEFSLVVNRDTEGTAKGFVYADDGTDNMASA
jgi:alpha-glucosidase (family GH31 glycosyl hydrolase)